VGEVGREWEGDAAEEENRKEENTILPFSHLV
jgi:hypothetical protein